MKKFFVAFLLIAIAAGNVFAEVTFSGELFSVWDVIMGESGDGAETFDSDGKVTGVRDTDSSWFKTRLGLSDTYIRTRLNVTVANEDNTFGGWFRIQASALDGGLGWVWWQPISQVKATLGLIDGFRPFSRLGDADAKDYLRTAGYTVDIFPGYDAKQGVSLLLTPVANLKIGLSAPFMIKPVVQSSTTTTSIPVQITGDFDNNPSTPDTTMTVNQPQTRTSTTTYSQPAEVSYRRIGGWVNYTLDGIGDIALGFKGSSKDYTGGTDYGNGHLADAKSAIHLGFNLTAVENLTFNFGAAYPIPQDTDGDVKTIKSTQNPISISLAADYAIPDTFGVRALASVSFGGKTEYEAAGRKPDEGALVIGAAIYPWVNVGVGKVGLVLGLKSAGESKSAGTGQKDGSLHMEVAPYFTTAYGGGSFYAGVRIGYFNYPDAKTNASGLTWSIPIGLSYKF